MLKYQPKRSPLAQALSASKIPRRSRELGALIKKAEQLQTLDIVFNESIPDLYKGKFQANGIKNRTLIITCHSASLATRLRFDKKTIIEKFNQRSASPPISNLKIRIRPGTFETDIGQKARTLSKENAKILLEEAEQTRDKNLRAVLVRLAEHSN